jgi:uncharacterized protein
MNIVAFAMPPQAYLNPLAYGVASDVDLPAYAFNFILVDGKMRGLFSFLFGASMLLVSQRAEANGESAFATTYRRQLWLLVFGMIHFYLIWYGDILIGYALIGMVAFLFRRHEPASLVAIGIILVAVQLVVMLASADYASDLGEAMAAPGPDPSTIAAWKMISGDVAVPSAAKMREIFALFLGPWSGIVRHQLTDQLFLPLVLTGLFGWETLAYMLFGMAALKSGLLTGSWSDSWYRRVAISGLAVGIPAYALLALLLVRDGFTVPGIFAYALAAPVPIRAVMVVAYAALIILLTRDMGWLSRRIAAAGRAAFTNYLGTSLLMTAFFYGWGLGLFGILSRAWLWPVVILMWVVMLAWSKPWLDHFRYGPFEWLWRCLARWKLQPMLRRPPVAPGA